MDWSLSLLQGWQLEEKWQLLHVLKQKLSQAQRKSPLSNYLNEVWALTNRRAKYIFQPFQVHILVVIVSFSFIVRHFKQNLRFFAINQSTEDVFGAEITSPINSNHKSSESWVQICNFDFNLFFVNFNFVLVRKFVEFHPWRFNDDFKRLILIFCVHDLDIADSLFYLHFIENVC